MDPPSRSTDFVALGHPGSDHYAGLETFANPRVSHVEIRSDEFAAVCPLTGQPDLYREHRVLARGHVHRVDVAQAVGPDSLRRNSSARRSKMLRMLTETIDSGMGSRPTDNVQKVTGAPPIKFADFARRTAQAWT